MRKVAVLFGGESCENEISVLTGVFVLKVLEGSAFEPIPVYIHIDGKMYTSSKMKDLSVFREKKFACFQRVFFDGDGLYALDFKRRKIKKLWKIDVAINCCHGGLGEGGGVSAMMAWNAVPFASPDLTASAVFMDKSMSKVFLRGLGIPTLDHIRVNEKDYEKRGAFLLRNVENRLKYPVVIKPAHLGSSIGIAVARNESEARSAIEAAFALDDRLIIEKYLQDKRDVNCAAYSIGGEIFVSEPETAFGDGIYSFEEKYIKRTSDGAVGKGGGPYARSSSRNGEKSENEGGRYALSGELREKIRSFTKTVYKRMNLQGIVRMDFLASEGRAYLCEVNTVPGSLAYYLFCERILDARQFFSALLEDAIERSGKEKKKIVTTGILQGVHWKRK